MPRQSRKVTLIALALIWPLAACGSGGNEQTDTSSEQSTAMRSESTPASTSASKEEQSATAQGNDTESAAQLQRFEGTVRVLNIDELAAMHQEDPEVLAGMDDEHVVVLVLDTPTQADVLYPQEQKIRKEKISMILMAQDYPIDGGKVASFESMDGQHKTMLVSADNLVFPTDQRPPKAEPFAREFELEP
ncbi:hypothetical protein CPPEL_08310 [Corynebacterium pseudopelargi]|uniref:Lipoprotein n=2 Tax=Corynebacterium pseudopelargi TaxID=2080757 RepID=A0A3G6IVU5_9CORY|nr:hypothetical protein CPPEL_08310 [Corynebacterium pseudopelargi]